jgi:anti-anti-sigma regulatory factor
VPPAFNPDCLDVERIGRITVVRFRPGVAPCEQTGRAFVDYLVALVAGEKYPPLVLNCGQLETLDGLVVTNLVLLDWKLRARMGRLVLCDLRPRVSQLLEQLKLAESFAVFDEEAHALQRLETARAYLLGRVMVAAV